MAAVEASPSQPELKVTHRTNNLPHGLFSLDAMAEDLHVKAERLLGFVESRYCPHYRIDDGPPLFQKGETREWARRNLVTHESGRDLPDPVAIVLEPAVIGEVPIPAQLSNLVGLCRFSNPPRVAGVYFLCQKGKVTYVGQSVDVFSRVHGHEQWTSFDAVFFLPVPEAELDRIEGGFIRLLKPELNGGRAPRGDLAFINGRVVMRDTTPAAIVEALETPAPGMCMARATPPSEGRET